MKKKWRQFTALFLAALFCLPLLRVQAGREGLEIAERMEKARELGLQEWVDEEGYLTEAFYEGKSDRELSEMGLDGLIRTLTEEELDAYVSRLNEGISLYTVTRYEKVSQTNPDTGRELYTGIFEVDGKLAFCIERSVETPPRGSSTGSPQLVSNNNIRKVLYYGYNGPADKGYTYVETALAAGEANGDGDNSLGRKILAEIVKFATPPSSFKVWKVETNGGRTQDLAYYTMEAKGFAKLKKVSENVALTDGNDYYSLAGAVYGVYSDSTCSKRVGSLTTKANGETDALELAAGTYYVKEISAPKGYLLNSEVETITIRASETAVVTVSDDPKTIIPEGIIQKVDSETGESWPQGKGSLAGAKFLMKFYAGNYSEGVNPDTQGVKPTRQWIFQTDETGLILFQKEYLVSGDEFWTDDSGKAILPLGTVTMQEVESSDGYRVNPQIFVQKIANENDTYQTTTVAQDPIQLTLLKYYDQEEQVISGVSFEHTSPDGIREVIQTDEKGMLTLKGLQRGTHQIREIAAPEMYMLNGNVLTFVVGEKNEIQVQSQAVSELGKLETSIDADGNLMVKVENLRASFELILYKENEKGKRLQDAEFTVYSDAACTEEVTKGKTNEMGELRITGLQTKTTYYLKETKAPQGYADNPIVYEIYSDGTEEQKEISMTIVNQTGMKLPNTGSFWMVPILFIGGMCFVAAIYKGRKKQDEI